MEKDRAATWVIELVLLTEEEKEEEEERVFVVW